MHTEGRGGANQSGKVANVRHTVEAQKSVRPWRCCYGGNDLSPGLIDVRLGEGDNALMRAMAEQLV
jgi:hypothetical protein